jgi:DNA modification methylase
MNASSNDQPSLPVWKNNLSDIWFATKSSEFMFKQKPVSKSNDDEDLQSNFWGDMLGFSLSSKHNQPDDIPNEIASRILKASSFKLNWVLDPFARTGGIGIIAKKIGRRFIGFEINKDKLILAMKRIDSEEK